MPITTFDNRLEKVGDDIRVSLDKANLYIAAKRFSLYGYETLSKELSKIEKMHFIFTAPPKFNEKEQRVFSLKSIDASTYEIELKNKLTSAHTAKKCSQWVRKKATFKALTKDAAISEMTILQSPNENALYLGIDEFSANSLGYKKDNTLFKPIIKIQDNETIKKFTYDFLQIWKSEALEDITQALIESLQTLYKENSPEFIYYLILFHIFNQFVEDLDEDTIANEKTGFKDSVIWNKLFDFQKDAVLGLINKLEKYGGAILADSVGLGKTFSALAVIKYYQEKNRSILVLCPKKLGENWKTYLSNYKDNPLIKDRFNL